MYIIHSLVLRPAIQDRLETWRLATAPPSPITALWPSY